MKPSCNEFKQQAERALADTNLQASLAKLGSGLQAKRSAALAQLPEYEPLRDEAQAIKRFAMANLDHLLVQFEHQVRLDGGHVHWAQTTAEAQQAILQICRNADAKTVTKGKSMVTEELGLNAFLQAQGIEPVETDLGEYILQLRNEAPSHVVVPAVHLLKQDIAQTFRKAHHVLAQERDLDAAESLVTEARDALRQKFLSADVGITGANYLIAETGSTVIVTNEGNGDLTQTLPRVHLVVTTIERVIPTLNDLSVFLRLLPRAATGQPATSYVTVSTGPRRADDLAGPEAFHIVLLDNGRSDLLGSAEQDILNCIRCGACMNHCPVYGAVGGHSYGWVYPGPLGAALNPALIGIDAAEPLPQASTFCGKCDEVCPVKIPLTGIMRHWRNSAWQRQHAVNPNKLALRLWAFCARRPWLYRLLVQAAARVLHHLARGQTALTKLPLAQAWTAHRDLPAPQSASFHTELVKALKHQALSGVRHE